MSDGHPDPKIGPQGHLGPIKNKTISLVNRMKAFCLLQNPTTIGTSEGNQNSKVDSFAEHTNVI